MIISLKLVLLWQFIIKIASGVKYEIENSSITPDSAAVAILKSNCSAHGGFSLKTHYDLAKNKWLIIEPPLSCGSITTPSSLKDVLAYCLRVYPNLNVVNIVLAEKNALFSIKTHEPPSDDQVDEVAGFRDTSVSVYKCLYGRYTPVNLYVPEKCSFQHFFNQNECQTDEKWTLLINEKCESMKAYLHDFRLLQWCDAFSGGLSTFTGVEFVCCNLTTKSTESNTIEDDNIDYVNDDMLVTKIAVPTTSDKLIEMRKSESTHKSQESNSRRVVTIMIALGIIFTVCFILIKKRMSQNKPDRLMVPVCTNDCPEMNHMNNMQVNGYENPTYKFFELQN